MNKKEILPKHMLEIKQITLRKKLYLWEGITLDKYCEQKLMLRKKK